MHGMDPEDNTDISNCPYKSKNYSCPGGCPGMISDPSILYGTHLTGLDRFNNKYPRGWQKSKDDYENSRTAPKIQELV